MLPKPLLRCQFLSGFARVHFPFRGRWPSAIVPGSAGCQPAVVSSLLAIANAQRHFASNMQKKLFGRLPKRDGPGSLCSLEINRVFRKKLNPKAPIGASH
jgi:hypothetical protein